MTYNTTFMNNTPSFLAYYNGINTASSSILSIVLLMVLWVVIFISMKHFDTKVVFLSASTTTTMVAIFMFALHWIPLSILFFPLVMTMFSLVAFLFSKN